LALALAAHPIRIEAPIPGKSLVGIEIPNSTKTTVGLARFLASEEFQNSDKPLLVSLGKGISGKSHFANMGKMPHLLLPVPLARKIGDDSCHFDFTSCIEILLRTLNLL
jgi:S-DNA-T family DNA segregation ATPase FtsK/SpoIIIE